MAKLNGKKKKKAKKGGKKRQDDWAFDGSAPGAKPDAVIKQKGPRSTQNRDDKLRRQRRRQDERQRERDFKNKMSKKVKFEDVLDEEGNNEKEMEFVHETDESNKISGKKQHKRNPNSPFDRFFNFVEKNLDEDEDEEENDEDEEDDEEDDDDHDEGELGEEEGDDEVDNGMDQEEEGDDNDMNNDEGIEEDGNDEMSDSEDDGEAGSRSNGVFEKYFASNSEIDSSKIGDKYSKLQKSESLEVFGCLPDDSVLSKIPKISKYQDIEKMPKLWRSRGNTNVSDFGSLVLPHMTCYRDVLIDGRSHENDDKILNTVLLHAMTHTVRARSVVLRHNRRLKEKAAAQALKEAMDSADSKKQKKNKTSTPAKSGKNDATVDDDAQRDQGFCRPRVVILCPYRHNAYDIVQNLKAIFGKNTSVVNMDKLEEEYGPPNDDDDEEDDYNPFQSKKTKKNKKNKNNRGETERPEDWQAIFHKKNVDDDFKLGIQINPGKGKGSGSDKGVQMRLFSDFFISDIIIASPLGLRLVIEKSIDVEDGNIKKIKKTSLEGADFLTSVEVVYAHQSDVLYMQNWEHLCFILKCVNQMPVANHDTDFSRVRNYFLEGNASQHRQLIMSTAFMEPEILSTFREHATSISGKIRLKSVIGDGSIVNIASQTQQIFQRLPDGAASISDVSDVRFQYFKDSILTPLLRTKQERTLIVTPSYFDYIRIRNELIRQDANACFVCEYSRESEISRGRSRFFQGHHPIMLYSGRAHFFRRFRIRGASNVIFYSLPEYPEFYSEIVNFMEDEDFSNMDEDDNDDDNDNAQRGNQSKSSSSKKKSIALYSRFDKMALDRIVGPKRSQHLTQAEKATFMFQ